MKVEKSLITFIKAGTEVTLEAVNIEAKDLAHQLIELAQPKLDIVVTDSLVKKFNDEAKREYVGDNKLFTDYDAYVTLYVRLKISEYIRIEHAKQAYNDAVIHYSNLIAELKQKP